MARISYVLCDRCGAKDELYTPHVKDIQVSVKRDGGMRNLDAELCDACFDNLFEGIKALMTKEDEDEHIQKS